MSALIKYVEHIPRSLSFIGDAQFPGDNSYRIDNIDIPLILVDPLGTDENVAFSAFIVDNMVSDNGHQSGGACIVVHDSNAYLVAERDILRLSWTQAFILGREIKVTVNGKCYIDTRHNHLKDFVEINDACELMPYWAAERETRAPGAQTVPEHQWLKHVYENGSLLSFLADQSCVVHRVQSGNTTSFREKGMLSNYSLGPVDEQVD